MQSCAIDLRQRLFRCSHHEKKLSVKLAKNGRKNIWSVKVGEHQHFVHFCTNKNSSSSVANCTMFSGEYYKRTTIIFYNFRDAL